MSLVLSTSLEIPKPSLWPIAMGRYGIVPEGGFKGDPIYRVVFAPTCRKLTFGMDPLGVVGAHNRAKHPTVGKKWILEKWISGWNATKMTPGEYERWGPRDPQSGMLVEGPYPRDGVYEHCWTFDTIAEIDGVEKIILLIQRGANRSASEIKAGNAEIDAKEEKAAAEKRFLQVRETEPLYGVRPANFAGTPKAANHKTARMPVSANTLAKRGMPTKRGSCVSMKGPVVNASI